jgi:RNA polymerase sigma-70 factor, ECF subfamily
LTTVTPSLAATPARAEPPPETSSLERLVQRHQRTVQRFLRALGADAAAADDLAQDVFVLAWEKRVVLADERAMAAWLVRTARHLWLREVRFARRRAEREAIAIERLWLDRCADDGGDRFLFALAACRRQLTPHVAEALALVYERGLSREAAAAAIGLLPNGLKTLLQRARSLLRRCMEQRLDAVEPGRDDDDDR